MCVNLFIILYHLILCCLPATNFCHFCLYTSVGLATTVQLRPLRCDEDGFFLVAPSLSKHFNTADCLNIIIYIHSMISQLILSK